MLNRTLVPDFNPIENIDFLQPQSRELSNGIKVFTINAGRQELVRMEFIFQNVNWDEKKPLQAQAVGTLINNGTLKLSAKEIAEKIDFYGAFLQTEFAADYITVTLYSLNKHLEAVLPVIWSILNESIFPDDELSIFIQNQKQKLKVNLQKNDFLARKTFAHQIFGNTAYGFGIALENYDALQRNDLLDYFRAAFSAGNCTIIASGKVGERELELLDTYFGKNWENNGSSTVNHFSYSPVDGKEIYIERADAVQSALRLGNLSINRTHPDFPSLQVVNTLFGGYFGSRLMANIREDKGYTYGIGSGIASLRDAGYFFIATEVGTAVSGAALQEIEHEINLLKTEMVSEEELDLVRNYMLGSLLGSLENAFSHADKFKNIYFSGLTFDYYDRYIQRVQTITPEEIKVIANRYLNWNAMTRVIVGQLVR